MTWRGSGRARPRRGRARALVRAVNGTSVCHHRTSTNSSTDVVATWTARNAADSRPTLRCIACVAARGHSREPGTAPASTPATVVSVSRSEQHEAAPAVGVPEHGRLLRRGCLTAVAQHGTPSLVHDGSCGSAVDVPVAGGRPSRSTRSGGQAAVGRATPARLRRGSPRRCSRRSPRRTSRARTVALARWYSPAGRARVDDVVHERTVVAPAAMPGARRRETAGPEQHRLALHVQCRARSCRSRAPARPSPVLADRGDIAAEADHHGAPTARTTAWATRSAANALPVAPRSSAHPAGTRIQPAGSVCDLVPRSAARRRASVVPRCRPRQFESPRATRSRSRS